MTVGSSNYGGCRNVRFLPGHSPVAFEVCIWRAAWRRAFCIVFALDLQEKGRKVWYAGTLKASKNIAGVNVELQGQVSLKLAPSEYGSAGWKRSPHRTVHGPGVHFRFQEISLRRLSTFIRGRNRSQCPRQTARAMMAAPRVLRGDFGDLGTKLQLQRCITENG